VQGNRAARRILGLEAALIDHSPIEIMPLDAADTRRTVTRFCDLSPAACRAATTLAWAMGLPS
jgi:hypothetical protein